MPKGSALTREDLKAAYEQIYNDGLALRDYAKTCNFSFGGMENPDIIECTDYREVTDDAERLQLPAPISPHQ